MRSRLRFAAFAAALVTALVQAVAAQAHIPGRWTGGTLEEKLAFQKRSLVHLTRVARLDEARIAHFVSVHGRERVNVRWHRRLLPVQRREIRATRAKLAAARAAARAAAAAVPRTGELGGSALCGPACIQCESGGNPQAASADGSYWGLYQFDYPTWVAHGGNPAMYGTAGAAEQHAVASRITHDAWPNC